MGPMNVVEPDQNGSGNELMQLGVDVDEGGGWVAPVEVVLGYPWNLYNLY